jgi:hypothetical protein
MFRTILDVIHGSLIRPTKYSDFMQNVADDKNTHGDTSDTNPTISDIAK